MGTSNWRNGRKNKDIAREMALGMIPADPYKSGLLLPSGSCIDLKQMMKDNDLKPNSRIVLVERDSETAKKINATCRKLSMSNYRIHVGELATLDLTDEPAFDVAILDLCGQVNEKLIHWLNQNQAWFSNTRLSFTFCNNIRQTPRRAFFDKLTDALGYSHWDLICWAKSYGGDIQIPAPRVSGNRKSDNVFDAVWLSFFAVVAAMSDTPMETEVIFPYHDQTPDGMNGSRSWMSLFVFNTGGLADTPPVSYDDIKHIEAPKKKPANKRRKKNPASVAAGKKAAATRKRNARAAARLARV